MNTILVKIHSIELIDNDTCLNASVNFCLEEGKEVYNNDGTFSHVRIDDNISVNISNNEIKYQLRTFIGKSFTIMESGNKIYIDKDFIGEYLYSKSTLALNKKKKIIKFLIIPYINLIVENSSNRFYSNDCKEKHILDAKYGFYKYQIKISVLYNNLEELFSVNLVIRNDANKKKYLYDIISIKKID